MISRRTKANTVGCARPDPVPQTHVQLDQGLARAANALAAAHSLADVVSILRTTARTIVGADGIAVILREDGDCFYAAEDAIEILWQGRRFPLDTCISGWAMLNNETAIVPDINLDPRVPVDAYRTTSMRSLVMVPIGSPEPVAALGAYWCASVISDEATVYRLETLAHHIAAALARISIESGADRPGVPE